QQQQQQQQQQQGEELLQRRLLECYTEICMHFKPVLSLFFLEAAASPGDWFMKRRQFVVSAAAASVAGFAAGLGDRHLGNLLLQQQTGQLVHIDFGILFELGSLLPIPETIPFRLSRDIADALGCFGVQGPFKSFCCCALLLLRCSSPLVDAVLQVLLLDPLYSWRHPSKLLLQQQQQQQHLYHQQMLNHQLLNADTEGLSTVEGNKIAMRAILKVRCKLQGLETEGEAPLSVAAQVDRLLNAAQSPHNLSRLFAGWMPFA
ncbi:Related to phosphotidylinositol kinase, related, partial [Eimeria tenella]